MRLKMLVGKMLRMLLFQWSEVKLVEMGESPRLLRHQMENAWSFPDVLLNQRLQRRMWWHATISPICLMPPGVRTVLRHAVLTTLTSGEKNIFAA